MWIRIAILKNFFLMNECLCSGYDLECNSIEHKDFEKLNAIVLSERPLLLHNLNAYREVSGRITAHLTPAFAFQKSSFIDSHLSLEAS